MLSADPSAALARALTAIPPAGLAALSATRPTSGTTIGEMAGPLDPTPEPLPPAAPVADEGTGADAPVTRALELVSQDTLTPAEQEELWTCVDSMDDAGFARFVSSMTPTGMVGFLASGTADQRARFAARTESSAALPEPARQVVLQVAAEGLPPDQLGDFAAGFGNEDTLLAFTALVVAGDDAHGSRSAAMLQWLSGAGDVPGGNDAVAVLAGHLEQHHPDTFTTVLAGLGPLQAARLFDAVAASDLDPHEKAALYEQLVAHMAPEALAAAGAHSSPEAAAFLLDAATGHPASLDALLTSMPPALLEAALWTMNQAGGPAQVGGFLDAAAASGLSLDARGNLFMAGNTLLARMEAAGVPLLTADDDSLFNVLLDGMTALLEGEPYAMVDWLRTTDGTPSYDERHLATYFGFMLMGGREDQVVDVVEAYDASIPADADPAEEAVNTGSLLGSLERGAADLDADRAESLGRDREFLSALGGVLLGLAPLPALASVATGALGGWLIDGALDRVLTGPPSATPEDGPRYQEGDEAYILFLGAHAAARNGSGSDPWPPPNAYLED